MSVDLKDWLKVIAAHPLRFRFEGLHTRQRDSKRACFRDVRDAVMSDENYWDRRQREHGRHIEALVRQAVDRKEDPEGLLLQFCDYATRNTTVATWCSKELPLHAKWEEAPIDDMVKVYKAIGDNVFYAFVHEETEIGEEIYLDMSEEEKLELLAQHPPTAVLSHAYEEEIDLEDVFFLCPCCNEPQTESQLMDMHGSKNGYPIFYCGVCGSEMQVSSHGNILDFFMALDITPYPFSQKKKDIWAKKIQTRKEFGANKLEIVEGDIVVLKKVEFVREYSRYDDPTCPLHESIRDEPGKVVVVSSVTPTGICYVNTPYATDHCSFDKIYEKVRTT